MDDSCINFEYDVCLSFAGEDRDFVKQVAEQLVQLGVRVFYDEYEEVNLWGKNLYEHLHYIYSNASRYCVIFISDDYVRKAWTRRENESAQERAMLDRKEYILPVRLSEAKLPGLLSTIGYLQAQLKAPEILAKSIASKVMPEVMVSLQKMTNYFPSNVDRLFEYYLNTKDGIVDTDAVLEASLCFFHSFTRLSDSERLLVGATLMFGCFGELPDFVHINSDLLRRIVKMPSKIVKSELLGMRALGFEAAFREFDESGFEDIKLSWISVIPSAEGYYDTTTNFTEAAAKMMLAMSNDYCESHALSQAVNANFMSLSSITNTTFSH